MNAKFVIYALIVSFACTAASWSKLLYSSGSGSGSSWSSGSGRGGGYSGSWGGGGHK